MSTNKDILLKIDEILKPILKENNLELWDLEFVKEGQNLYLRIYIDKEDNVSIDDCEVVSRALEVKLDEYDPIEQPYILEVSSPGINRVLKRDEDFIRFIGEIVDIKLYKSRDNKKEFTGELLSLENNIVSILDENKNKISFERKEIAVCRLAVFF